MRDRISNAALRRQIVRHARHHRRGRYGPAPIEIRDPQTEGGRRVVLGEEVPHVFGSILPDGLRILAPMEFSICALSPAWTWRDAMRSKLQRDELSMRARLEAQTAYDIADDARELDDINREMRADARRLAAKRVAVAVMNAARGTR